MAYSGTIYNFMSVTSVYATWTLDDNGKMTVDFPDSSEYALGDLASPLLSALNDAGAPVSDVKSAMLTGKPKSLTSILEGFFNLVSVDMSALDSSRLTDMFGVFRGCTSLPSVDMSALDTANVTRMLLIFDNCDVLSEVTLGSGFSTSALTNNGLHMAPCSNGTTYCPDDAAFCSLSAAEHAGTWTRHVVDSYKVTGERTANGNDVTFTVVWATTSASSTRTLTIYRKEAGETVWPDTAAGTWTLSGNSGNTVVTIEDVGDAKADFKVIFDDGAVKRIALVPIEGNNRLVTVDESGNFWCAGTLPIDRIYPVGSIYMSVNAVDPGTLFGGTWGRIQDRFLLAAGDSYAAGTTGGEATHTLTQTEMPNHNHSSFYISVDRASGKVATRFPVGGKADNLTELKDGTASVGGGQAHNNMPPYLAVYVWKRTA